MQHIKKEIKKKGAEAPISSPPRRYKYIFHAQENSQALLVYSPFPDETYLYRSSSPGYASLYLFWNLMFYILILSVYLQSY